MASVEVVLVYRPQAGGSAGSIHIGTTSNPRALRAVRDALIEDAEEDVRAWQSVSPELTVLKRQDAEALQRVLATLLPDEDLRPRLRVVEPTHK